MRRALLALCVIALALTSLDAQTNFRLRRAPAAAQEDGPDDFTAATCDDSDVNAAIDLASDGDIVGVPAGSCTWNDMIHFLSKNIFLRGAGAGVTNITMANATGIRFDMDDADDGDARISGFTFTGSTPDFVIRVISSTYAGVPTGRWRIDHNHFNFSATQQTGIFIQGVNYGVIDNNTWDWHSGVAIFPAMAMASECGGGGSDLAGDLSNTQPLNWSDDKYVFVENNTFTGYHTNPSFIDGSGGGGRIVVRYNDVTGSYLYNHWTRGCELGIQVLQAYRNTFTTNGTFGTAAGSRVIDWEAGTGVIYENSFDPAFSGGDGAFVFLTELRGGGSQNTAPLNDCDGSEDWDGNIEASGWPCLGQIGRAPGKSFAAIQGGDKQASAPVYLWSNGEESTCATGGACTNTVLVFSGNATYIKATAHSNGNVDYVENGTTAMPGYTAPTYPHALVTSGWTH